MVVVCKQSVVVFLLLGYNCPFLLVMVDPGSGWQSTLMVVLVPLRSGLVAQWLQCCVAVVVVLFVMCDSGLAMWLAL